MKLIVDKLNIMDFLMQLTLALVVYEKAKITIFCGLNFCSKNQQSTLTEPIKKDYP
ncbi:hypothetical protein ACSBO6_18895 [Bacillus sp. AL-1R]